MSKMSSRREVLNLEHSKYVAGLQLKSFHTVFLEWKEIALVLRDKVFEEDQEEDIDIFDLKCKEWGFWLLEVFGVSLGTGDYGHMSVEHASMLMRNFRSLRHYSNQGFEAAHKLQKQMYSRGTNHDASGPASSRNYLCALNLWSVGCR
ncbi:hypothetical protein QZH41_019332 [Actinostola sp. cb2023]|nr:hypothetical protein QZH41_019332 [Actinostola sp. cb2023]